MENNDDINSRLSREEIEHQVLNRDIFNLELRIAEFAAKKNRSPLDSERYEYYDSMHKDLLKYSAMIGWRICSQPQPLNTLNRIQRREELVFIRNRVSHFNNIIASTSQQIDEIATIENSSQSRNLPTSSERSLL